MKIRSLLLGSAAVAGLTTGAYAADLGVMTSLDVCDSLGLSGLTISSDSNCLQITGEVKYKFVWGDYVNPGYDPLDGSGVTDVETPAGVKKYDIDNDANDWQSRLDAWIKFVATADSDFGPAKAVLKLKQTQNKIYTGYTSSFGSVASASASVTYVAGYSNATVANGGGTVVSSVAVYGTSASSTPSASGYTSRWGVSGTSTNDAGVVLDEAYVSIGDSTVIMAGKKGSLYNKGDDVPLNWLGLFNSEKVDVGVGGPDKGTSSIYYGYDHVSIDDGGHVIQITSDLGNGFSIGGGLEKLDNSDYLRAGTAVGVLTYSGDGISAHASFEANGVLAGEIQDWRVHAGFAGTFDNFKVVAAGYFDSSEYWNVLASASATFDMFTIAGSVEAASAPPGSTGYDDYWGAGGSISAAVTDTVTVNVGGRWAHTIYDNDAFEVAAGVVASVTDSITLTGKVGYVDDDWQDVFYGQGIIAWAPGGGFTASATGTINSDGGYKLETVFDKTFQ